MWRALPGETYNTLCVLCDGVSRTVMHTCFVSTVLDAALQGSVSCSL